MTGQLTDEQTAAIEPAPRIGPPGPMIRHLGKQLPPHHVRADRAPRNAQGYPDDAA